MNVITWSDEYSVDIQEIDEQHKVLVDLINKLYAALSHKGSREEVGEVIEELVDYTRVHFAVEECLLRIFGFPGYEQHKAIHDGIVEKLGMFQHQFEAGDDEVGMELLLFVKDWLLEHISREDKQYSSHLAKHGVKQRWLKKFF